MDILLLILVVALLFFLFTIKLNAAKLRGNDEIRLDPIRKAFLDVAFGMEPSDYSVLGFDGVAFHHKGFTPYEKYSAASLVSEKVVRVFDENLPHDSEWRYRRVDGGPDRRYKNNRRLMTSKKCEIHFKNQDGQVAYRRFAYIRPNGFDGERQLKQLHCTIAKINTFLSCTDFCNPEEFFEDYSVHHRLLVEAKNSMCVAENALEECRSSLAAYETLKASRRSTRENDERAQVWLDQEFKLIKEKARILQVISNEERQMAAVVSRLKDQIEINCAILKVGGS